VAEPYALDRIHGKVINSQELTRQDWLDLLETLKHMNQEIGELQAKVLR
jgi:hypothetical protein